MSPTSRPSTPQHARAPRRGLVAIVMLLLTLGASLLVSAGSEHHRQGPTIMVVQEGDTTVAHSGSEPTARLLSEHEHHHGADWAPIPGKRLRPATTVALLGIVPARPAWISGLRAEVAVPAIPPAGDGLALLGVLRV